MLRGSIDLRALSKLTDVTRSVGVEYGFELLLWLTYANWRGLLGPSVLDAPPDDLMVRLMRAAADSPWTPDALAHRSKGLREAETVRQALWLLDDLVRRAIDDGANRRSAHADLFEGLLSQVERGPARNWEEAATPLRVAQLMVELCRQPVGRVLDPAAGVGSALLSAHHAGAASLTAWDISSSALGVLRARIELAGAAHLDARVLDTLREGSAFAASWDTVLLAPPWGMRPRDQISFEDLPVKVKGNLDLPWAMIAGRLCGSGQAVVHLPVGALTRAADQDARRLLLSTVEAVVALPAGAGAGSGVRSALVILGQPQTDDVLMLTAEDAASSQRRTLEWNDEVLLDVVGRLARWREGAGSHDIEERGRAKVVARRSLQRDAVLHPMRYAGTPAAAEGPRPDPPGRLITKLWLENFKSFGPAVELELAPITLIYGPNASGKSSVIQSLLLQKQSLETGTITLSGMYAGLGSVGGTVHRHDDSRQITVGFELAVPVRWEMASEAVSPGVTRAVKLAVSSDAAGSPALNGVELRAGGFGFRFLADPEQNAGWRLPLDGAVRLVEMASDPEVVWQADARKKPLSARRASDVRRVLGQAHADEGVPVASTGLLPDRVEIDFTRYAEGTTHDPAELAGASLRRSFGLLNGARADLERALRELCYLGPVRSAPERTYERGAVSRQRTLDPKGADAANVLFDSPSDAQAVSKWLNILKVPYCVSVHALQSEHPGVGDLLHMELLDHRFRPPVAVSAADVGFGVSQLLPLVVQLLVARDQVICIEQPEIHLHPRLQAEFAEILIESVSAEGRANQVIVETHSEHLMLRLQRKIRAGEIPAEDVAVLYVDIDETREAAEAKRIRLDDRGRFLDRWPGGFFDERFAEIFDPEALPTLPTLPSDEEDDDATT